jgi:hypothetical protein
VLGGVASLTGAVGVSSLDVLPGQKEEQTNDSVTGSATEDGTTHRAVRSGAWTDPDVWANGDTPVSGADVKIEPDVTVTLDTKTARVRRTDIQGTLKASRSASSHLMTETLYVQSGGALDFGHEADTVTTQVEVTFIDTGPFDIASRQRGLVVEGDLMIHGSPKTAWSTVTADPLKDSTSVTLATEPMNWSPGDEILIPGTAPNTDEDERKVIDSIDGATVTFRSSLDSDHTTPEAGDAYALNVTRNIIFRSEAEDPTRRAHMIVLSQGTDARYCAWRQMGRTRKAEPVTNPIRNADTVPKDQPTNPIGRYSFHWHITGIDAAEPHYAEGLVVEDSPGWGIVHHHAYGHVQNCITYDVLGSGIVSQSGNERGSFVGNFALRSNGSGDVIDSRVAGAHGGDPPIDDMGHAGHGFWIQSPLLEVHDNVAAGHRHQAFVWWLRPLLDGPMAEGQTIEDSRVTFHPNTPIEYVDMDRLGPLWEAIQQGRFATGRQNDVMRETEKLPSTFVPVAEIANNTAFASGGGVDFSRHNFKWQHERFNDFDVLEGFTIYHIGSFYDGDGEEHTPDLPRHRSSGHQGRGGNVGISFRYSSNVTLRNSTVEGTNRENSVGIPFHDYLWTLTVDNCTIEGWDWAVDTGEHRLTWVRNNEFVNNSVDINWGFDNAGCTVCDGNTLSTVRNDFAKRNQKAPEVLEFHRQRGLRINGRSTYVEESAPDYVPFPDADSLGGINNIERLVDSVDDETNLIGKTNARLIDQFGIAIGGRPHPSDALSESFLTGAVIDSYEGHETAVYTDPAEAGSLGAFEAVTDPNAVGDVMLRWTGSDSPKSNPACMNFDCAAGRYVMYVRAWPAAWNGNNLFVRIDGGEWKTVEKLKSPVGFAWHDASPNNGDAYSWNLSKGSHTLEIACDRDGVRLDEIFLGSESDATVLGAYGESHRDDESDTSTQYDVLG